MQAAILGATLTRPFTWWTTLNKVFDLLTSLLAYKANIIIAISEGRPSAQRRRPHDGRLRREAGVPLKFRGLTDRHPPSRP